MIVVAARPGRRQGARPRHRRCATPPGWTTMGEVAVGDRLLGADGRPTTVVAATDVMTDRPCYEVHFSDGSVIVADAQHQWLTDTRASRKSAQPPRRATTGTATSRRSPRSGRPRRSRDGPLREEGRPAEPLGHQRAAARAARRPICPCRPYALGVWLGDGTSAAAQYTQRRPGDRRLHRGARGWWPSSRESTAGTRCGCPAPARWRPRRARCAGAVRAADLAGADVRQGVRWRASSLPGRRAAGRRAPTAEAPRPGWRSARRAATSTARSRPSSAGSAC